MGDVEWGQVSERFAAEMGLDSCAWVAVRHDDVQRDGREHVHLLAVAVTDTGQRWDDSLDRPRAIVACREIEADRGLVVADAPERRGYGDATIPQAARYAARRDQEVPDKQLARGVLERAIDRCDGTWQGLKSQAEQDGLGLTFREREGRVTGVGVTIDRADGAGERTFKGSALARGLSAAGIGERLTERAQAVQRDRGPDRGMGW